jgi:pilus assembly protein CpaE
LAVLNEIRGLTQVPVLAVGPASDPKLILQALREGAYQYLDESQLEIEFTAALRRLASSGVGQDEPGRIITVLSPSGGSGSSTVAVNIATALAEQHKTCALFDMKLEKGDLATLLDVQPEHSVADFCQNLARMDRSMFQQCLTAHPSGVHLLASPGSYSDVSRVTPQGIRKALTMARGMFPYVVVDLDHSYREEHAQVLYQSDVILLVLRLDIMSLRQTRRILGYLEQLGIASERVRLAVNRYRWQKELAVSQMERALDCKIRYFIPDDPKSIKRANNNGVPVVLARPGAKVSKCLMDVAQQVNGRHKKS